MTHDNISPQPTISELSFDELIKYRYFECEHYKDCLELACAGDWISFVCTKCKIFKKRQIHECFETTQSDNN